MPNFRSLLRFVRAWAEPQESVAKRGGRASPRAARTCHEVVIDYSPGLQPWVSVGFCREVAIQNSPGRRRYALARPRLAVGIVK
jgi:hypothetical protein